MTSQRRCANWLTTYRDYILDRTDAPESFVFWSGLFTLASAIRRKVYIPKDYLGIWNCYPFLYITFVGPAGVRKTTTIDNGARILLSKTREQGVNIGPSVFSKEAILESMGRVSDSSMSLIIGEFSDVFQKAGSDRSGIYEFFTSIFDGHAEYVSATKTQGTLSLTKPCMNFFTATTPQWINSNMSEGIIGGGYPSRVIFVYEEKPRINKMFFDDVIYPYPNNTEITFTELETDLILDLRHIAKEIEGPFAFSPDGLEFAREWSEKSPPLWLSKNDKLAGYLNRKKMHIAKVAQLHSISQKDELVITKENWEFAVNAIESTELGLEKVFAGVGNNKYITEIDKIVAYVKHMNLFTNEAVARSDILRTFTHAAEPRALNDLIQFAMDSKYLIAEERKTDWFFWTPEFKPKNL